MASLERALSEAGKYESLDFRMRGGETEEDIVDSLSALIRDLYAIAPSELAPRWTELGESALSNLNELFESARREFGITSREELEARYEKVEARIGLLRRLKRETGLRSAEELTGYIGEVEGETAWLGNSSAILEERAARASGLRAAVASCARGLRSLREAAAADFGARVNRHLSDLAMEDIHFSVVINRLDKVRASGAESAAFMLSQSGLPPLPVGKAASGGELSRILIAIQASIESDRLPGVLVFDEVEAGLGGRTALLAGEKLRELSGNCRTILITHEATIAAMADQHFVVRRSGDVTEVCEISGEERAREIARMLAGSESREALEHARSLLNLGPPG
jgi:DNA repair protein RecN (Recombination protein N)